MEGETYRYSLKRTSSQSIHPNKQRTNQNPNKTPRKIQCIFKKETGGASRYVNVLSRDLQRLKQQLQKLISNAVGL